MFAHNGIRYIGHLLAVDQAQCRMEAGGISDREKLLGVGAVAAAAHLLGNGEVEVEPAVGTTAVTVASFAGGQGPRRYRASSHGFLS